MGQQCCLHLSWFWEWGTDHLSSCKVLINGVPVFCVLSFHCLVLSLLPDPLQFYLWYAQTMLFSHPSQDTFSLILIPHSLCRIIPFHILCFREIQKQNIQLLLKVSVQKQTDFPPVALSHQKGAQSNRRKICLFSQANWKYVYNYSVHTSWKL